MLYVLCALISALTPLIAASLLSANVTNSHVTQYAKIKRQVYNNYYTHNPTSPLYNPCASGSVADSKSTYTFTTTQSFLRSVDAAYRGDVAGLKLQSTVTTKFFTLHHYTYLVVDEIKTASHGIECTTCTATFNPDKNPAQDTQGVERAKQATHAQEGMHGYTQQLHDRHYVRAVKLSLGKPLRKRKILVMDSVRSEGH